MTFESFCELNNVTSSDNFLLLHNCVWPEYEFKLEFTAALYIHEGDVDFEINKAHYHFPNRTMAILKDGQTIKMDGSSADYDSYVLVVGGDLERDLSLSSVYLSMLMLDSQPTIKVDNKFRDTAITFNYAMSKVLETPDNPYKKDCLLSLLRAFFHSTGSFLFQSLNYSGTDLFSLSLKMKSERMSTISQFVSMVEKHAKTNRTLSFYAEKLGYNHKYLSSMIKRETGISGQDLIDQYAVLWAMSNLTYSKRSIKEISNEMEFPSQSDFGKFFKRMTGSSPLQYRKQSK